jgi:DNA mismatch repair protein MutS
MISHVGTMCDSKLVATTFTKKGKPSFKKMYYPKFINDESSTIIKNDCNLNKIITGPNASGKTTTLKSALINILLSQQIGFGCFESLKLCPYDKIHCYLNIPDTSGRDSLFQAEARRCKEIIDCIDEEKSKELTHFCIFDELYSGTNPEEAVITANAFMDYIVKNENVTCILTTHYVKLCKKLSKNKMIKNYNMKTIKKNDNFEYTYQLDEGISKIKGGLKVLHDMKYPKEILDLANKIN